MSLTLERSSDEWVAAAAEVEAIAVTMTMHQRFGGRRDHDGGEVMALDFIETCISDVSTQDSSAAAVAACAQAVVYNGQAKYEMALRLAERACIGADVGHRAWTLGEFVEAGVRSGNDAVARNAFALLSEQLQDNSEDWAQGLVLRSQALLAVPHEAEPLYRQAVVRFARAGLAVHRARAELLYGEWLRREGRRVDARKHLGLAQKTFTRLGFSGFAERARRELLATCPSARKRSVETRDDLTAQEVEVARLAGSGHTNPEIGSILFLSPRTVEWHLRKVFTKLGITSRRELRNLLEVGALQV